MKVKKSSPAWHLTALVLVVSLLLVACASNTPIATSTSIPPTSTPAPTATPSIAPPDAQGSALDQALLDEIWNSDLVQAQKTQWEVWFQYWRGATTPINIPDTKELRYELLIDPSNPPQAGNDPQLDEKVVLLLTWRNPTNKTKTVRAFFPVNATDGGFQTEPPTVESPYEIEKGTEPLFLSDGANLTLVWHVNDFVYLNEKGEVIAEIDRNGYKQETALGLAQMFGLPTSNSYKIENAKLLDQTGDVWAVLDSASKIWNLKYEKVDNWNNLGPAWVKYEQVPLVGELPSADQIKNGGFYPPITPPPADAIVDLLLMDKGYLDSITIQKIQIGDKKYANALVTVLLKLNGKIKRITGLSRNGYSSNGNRINYDEFNSNLTRGQNCNLDLYTMKQSVGEDDYSSYLVNRSTNEANDNVYSYYLGMGLTGYNIRNLREEIYGPNANIEFSGDSVLASLRCY